MLSLQARLTTIERTVHASVCIWQEEADEVLCSPTSTPESQVHHALKRQDSKESRASRVSLYIKPYSDLYVTAACNGGYSNQYCSYSAGESCGYRAVQ